MTKVVFNRTLAMIDRDSFLTPFDKMFDQLVSAHFPEMTKTVGVNPMSNTAYPKVNVYEYDDKVGVVAEIPGLDKKDLSWKINDRKSSEMGTYVEDVKKIMIKNNNLIIIISFLVIKMN